VRPYEPVLDRGQRTGVFRSHPQTSGEVTRLLLLMTLEK
jgi:hypothetical protein